MSTLRIVPYRQGSASARLLAAALSEQLGRKVWRGPALQGRNIKNIVWGDPSTANKIQAFQRFAQEGVSHVPYTTSKAAAQRWLAATADAIVFARTPSGQGGSGIHVVRRGERLPDMPLYTKYIRKQKEFRVHVVEGSVIDVQQKKKRHGAPDGALVRNLENGWIYAHEDVVEPTGLRDLGIGAVRAVGLAFGAVDIIWNEREDRCYVLEVNSAPGLCETTAKKYADAFIAHYG